MIGHSLSDRSGDFMRYLGMLIEQSQLGFGHCSGPTAMIVDDDVNMDWPEEPGTTDNSQTSPRRILKSLELHKAG